MAYRNIPFAIRKEFDEPMSDVIKGFAQMGYSMLATSRAMGIGTQAMSAWIKRLGLRHHFDRSNYNEVCKPINKKGGWPKGKKRDRRVKYTDRELLSYVATCPQYHKFNERPEFPAGSTVIRRFGSWNNAKCKAKEMTNGFNKS